MQEADTNNGKTRSRLAYYVVAGGAAGVIAISWVAIAYATPEKQETSRLVFSAVLPLLGTWVGTVLAYFFARENFQAATQSTTQLAESARRLYSTVQPSSVVNDAMIPKTSIVALTVDAGADPNAVKLSELRNMMVTSGKKRVPIMDAAGAVLYVMHESTLAAFANSIGKTLDQLADETMGDLLAVPELGKLVAAIGFVKSGASLNDARTEMGRIEGCNDVFVTPTGSKSEAVMGWLTNTDLASLP